MSTFSFKLPLSFSTEHYVPAFPNGTVNPYKVSIGEAVALGSAGRGLQSQLSLRLRSGLIKEFEDVLQQTII